MGLLSHDPFIGHRMSNAPTSREALNWEEIEKIEKLQHSTLKENQMNVLRGFLFACYTGLRFIDVRRLEWGHIVNGVIVMQMSKTGAVVRIPLSKKAAALLSEGDSPLFRLYKNFETNVLVKSLMVAAGISRKVTFHISRHTFATLSLNMGISMEVVSGLLGHANIKTTQIYAKILDKTREEMMKKWDEPH
jgi:integrase/recombinase XerC